MPGAGRVFNWRNLKIERWKRTFDEDVKIRVPSSSFFFLSRFFLLPTAIHIFRPSLDRR